MGHTQVWVEPWRSMPTEGRGEGIGFEDQLGMAEGSSSSTLPSLCLTRSSDREVRQASVGQGGSSARLRTKDTSDPGVVARNGSMASPATGLTAPGRLSARTTTKHPTSTSLQAIPRRVSGPATGGRDLDDGKPRLIAAMWA